jgi:malate dehydrogenase (oxaloacetate-decarboxylating)(NADP+)
MSNTLPRKAIIAISSFNGAIYPGGRKTGLFLTEALHPFEVLVSAGFEVDLASETGTFGFDFNSLQPPFLSGSDKAVYNNPSHPFMVKLKSQLKRASDLKKGHYGVFFASAGHSALYDYRRTRGMYLSIARKGRVKEVLRNWPERDVRVICVTDGGRILGLGDLGANGMGIPIGKLQLYTACAAVPPRVLLPMYLDVGTNNQTLLNDPLYLGLRQPRVSTEQLVAFTDEFVEAVQEVFPNCCIHFEDWTGSDAVHLLARYRHKVCCYNDDIQGTGSVTLAGLLAALKVTGGDIRGQRIFFFGAGSAAIGLAGLIESAMVQKGLSLKDAQARISMFDINGLLEPSRTDLFDFQMPYAHPHAPSRDLLACVESTKPTMLIGVSTVGQTFTKPVIEAMARLNERPIIFALSNPTEHAECTPQQAYEWSNGKALYAAGVQFPNVSYGGRTFRPGQANNFYIFPAVGMAIYATQARRVTDEMFIEAAHALADQLTPAELEQGLLFPPQANILETEMRIAVRAAKVVFDRNLAGVPRPNDLEAFIRSHAYEPEYQSLI